MKIILASVYAARYTQLSLFLLISCAACIVYGMAVPAGLENAFRVGP